MHIGAFVPFCLSMQSMLW